MVFGKKLDGIDAQANAHHPETRSYDQQKHHHQHEASVFQWKRPEAEERILAGRALYPICLLMMPGLFQEREN